MDLTDIDLNRLVLFRQLMAERSVSKAAENLGITQSAVSNALAKLRQQLGDELFLRSSMGMVPTTFAEQLAGPINAALDILQEGLNQDHFDPAKIKRSVTIGMTDIGEIIFLPTLIKRLRAEAPGIRLSTVRNSATNIQEDMESGRMDMAIGFLPQLKAGFFQRKLFNQNYVCLFRQGHPLERARTLTEADFKAAEHLVIMSLGTGHVKMDDLLAKSGIDRNIILTVPHFVSVGHILQQTNLVATVTEALASSLTQPFGLTYRPHPIKLPDIAINMFWHAKVHHSPLHHWLRDIIFDEFGKTPSPASPCQ
jgi:DNA-binding transcriptional LysR family regulator